MSQVIANYGTSVPEVTLYDLSEVKKKLEALYGSKLDLDDPSFVVMAGVHIIFGQHLQYSLRWLEECTGTAMAEYKQGLDATANDKKRAMRQELIDLGCVIHDKLKVDTDATNKSLLARIEDLKQVAASIGGNYSQYRWHDRVIGLLCASLLFLAAFASGMVLELFKR